jgi:hypothetical protein
MPLLKRKHNSIDKSVAEQSKLECSGSYDPNVSNDYEIQSMMLNNTCEQNIVFVRNFRSVAEHAYQSETLAACYAYACKSAYHGKLPEQTSLEPTELDYKLAELFVESDRLADSKYTHESTVVHKLCMDVYARFASRPEGRALETAKKASLAQIEYVRLDIGKHEQFGKVGYFLMNLALFIATFGLSLCFTGGRFNYFKTSNHERLDNLSDEIQTLNFHTP